MPIRRSYHSWSRRIQSSKELDKNKKATLRQTDLRYKTIKSFNVKTKELTLNDFSLFQSINYLLKVINKEQKYTFKLHKSQQAKGADKKLSIIFHLRQ